MNLNCVFTQLCDAKKLNIPQSEILRYMQSPPDDTKALEFAKKHLPLVISHITLKGCYVFLPLEITGDAVKIADIFVHSSMLAKNLEGAKMVMVFVLSCGLEIDRLIEKYKHINASDAFCINAVATAAIEEYADCFCREIENKHCICLKPRFSPGYGDFSIDNQEMLLKTTNAQKLLGITLTEKLMMMPSKTITAICGVCDSGLGEATVKCNNCDTKDCIYRKVK